VSLLLAPTAWASGYFPLSATFVSQNQPDPPLTHFAAGRLGLILPSWNDTYLYAAYRYLAGPGFNAEEQKVLRGAARAQRATRVPLTIHMPGWERLGHRVLDLVAEEGIDLHCVILDHMNPSGIDLDYQASLAERGAYLEYDMIGMDYYYADQHAQSPCDEENAAAVRNLIRFGHLSHLLLSQDVFLKMMLTRNGGFGYAYVLRHFVPRLRRHGVTEEQVMTMLIENPRRVFVNAAKEGS